MRLTNTIKRSGTMLLAVVLISGCASDPATIAPISINPAIYQGWSCNQLRQEKASQSASLEILVAQQVRAQEGDALGVFLIGLPTSSMSGNDKESEIANARGQLAAIEQNLIAKNCRQ